MKIIKTERKHWHNGKTVHGKDFVQYAYSFLFIGVIIAPTGSPKINLFWLT